MLPDWVIRVVQDPEGQERCAGSRPQTVDGQARRTAVLD